MGPGIITANADNDAGGITTYSLAGAQFGYDLLWTLIPITLALVVVQEMGARMGAVTGKGLADLIRERFGIKVALFVMIILVAANFGVTMAEFSGLAAGGEIFGLPKYLTLPVAAVSIWLLVVKGTYKAVEKVFLVISSFYLTYIISGFLANPPWGQVLVAIATPRIHAETAYFLMAIGVIGTTITPLMQFYLQSAVVEKGTSIREYGYIRADVYVGSLITDVVAFFIVLACGTTIFAQHLAVNSAADAAQALGPLAGQYASGLFALGLLNASLLSASIVPLSTSYYVCEAFGWERGVRFSFKEAPIFLGLYTAIIALAAGIVIIPGAPLLHIMFLSQVANGLLLPFILVFMLFLVNNRSLMGKYTNGPAFNLVAWLTVGVIILLTAALVVSYVTGAMGLGLGA